MHELAFPLLVGLIVVALAFDFFCVGGFSLITWPRGVIQFTFRRVRGSNRLLSGFLDSPVFASRDLSLEAHQTTFFHDQHLGRIYASDSANRSLLLVCDPRIPSLRSSKVEIPYFNAPHRNLLCRAIRRSLARSEPHSLRPSV